MRVMGKQGWGSSDKSAGDGEDWYETRDIFKLGKTPKVICIDNAANVITTSDKNGKLREVLEDLRLACRENWNNWIKIY